MDMVEKTCLFSLEFFTRSQTEYTLSNLFPKSPCKFVSKIEYNEKIPMQQPAVLDVSLILQTTCVCHLEMLMKKWPPSFSQAHSSLFHTVIH